MKRFVRIVTLATVSALALAGCLKTDSTFTIHENNTVDGTIYLATDKDYVDDATPTKTYDADEETSRYSNRTITHYETDRWYGDRIDIASEPLTSFVNADNPWDINIQRAGDQFVVSGVVPDPDEAETRQTIKDEDGSALVVVKFPGAVAEHNGTLLNANTVQWNMLDMTEAPYARGAAIPAAAPDPIVTVTESASPSASPSVSASPSPSVTAAPEQGTGGGVPTWVWIVAIGLVALLLALVGVMIGLLVGRKNNAVTPAVEPAEEPEQEPAAEPVADTKEQPTVE